MMCRGLKGWSLLSVALVAGCSAEHGPAAERAGSKDSGTAVDASSREAATIDAASAEAPDAAPPLCAGQEASNGPRFIIAAGAELLTHDTQNFGSAVEETALHGTVMETGSGIPDGLDPTVASALAHDAKGWRFVRIGDDAGNSWTILAQHLEDDLSFGVAVNERVDVRLRYARYAFAPLLLELLMRADAVPVFYYATAGELRKLLPFTPGLNISLGPVDCTTSNECFETIELHSLRVQVPDDVAGTLRSGEEARLGDYIVKHYGTARAAQASPCMDAVADHLELAVTRSL